MQSENAEVKIIRFTFVINLSVNRTYHSIIETLLSHFHYLMLLLAILYKKLLQTFQNIDTLTLIYLTLVLAKRVLHIFIDQYKFKPFKTYQTFKLH